MIAPPIPLTALPREVWPFVRGRVAQGVEVVHGDVQLLPGGVIRVREGEERVVPSGLRRVESDPVAAAQVLLDLHHSWYAVVAELARQLRPAEHRQELTWRTSHGAWRIGGLVSPIVACSDPTRADIVVDVDTERNAFEALALTWHAGIAAGVLVLPSAPPAQESR
jgi:hypothetical protein